MGPLARLPEAELRRMAAAFSALPNPVLWKLDPKDMPQGVSIESLNVAANVKVITWAPQNDVLGHESVRAFVSHGGNNSIYEAAYHAVPTVVMPCVADQGENAVKTEYHGFGIVIAPNKMAAMEGQPLHDGLIRILTEPAFMMNAIKVSKRLTNKPRQPVQLAADIVERALATGGENYLETRQHRLSWWQLSLLDVYSLLTLTATATVGLAALRLKMAFGH
ncbi:TPA: hypothetical protein ACH3X3_004706 [Trebouxia sp. C0006]